MVYLRQGRLTQAAELLDGVMLELQSQEPNLIQACQSAVRACHLLHLGEETREFESELKGYPVPQDVPEHRILAVPVLWGIDAVTDSGLRQLIIASNPALADSTERYALTVALAELVRSRNVGYLFPTGRRSVASYGGTTLPATQYMQISPFHLDRVLDKVAAHIFLWASRRQVAVEQDKCVGALFESCVAEGEECLAAIGLDAWLQQIREGIGVETPQGNASAVLACRNLITELSDHLLQVDAACHPTLKDKQGKQPMSLARDMVKNRYRAYLHEMRLRSRGDQLHKELGRLVDLAVELYDRASSGKRAIQEDDMRGCVTRTYLFIAELNRLTALQPIYDFTID
jgi:hypothetical protein